MEETIMRGRGSLVVLVGVIAAAATQLLPLAQAASETHRNRAVVTKHLELMNRGQWKEAAEMFAPDVRHHLGNWQSGEERIVTGRQALTGNLEDLYRTFPEWKMEVLEMVSEGESVVVRCRVSGTHRGVSTKRMNGGFLLGVPPTEKYFVVQHIHWYKVRGGKIAEHFTNRDDLGMTQQLGLLPDAQPAGGGK
jgi:steroid delta-isomerase-like uncharacterized protein